MTLLQQLILVSVEQVYEFISSSWFYFMLLCFHLFLSVFIFCFVCSCQCCLIVTLSANDDVQTLCLKKTSQTFSTVT